MLFKVVKIMNGKLIVIEGLDGSGKATQAACLTQYLQNNSINVLKVSFPDYDSPSSSLIKMYLAGEFGSDPDSVNPYAASAFYAVDRFASFKKSWEQLYNSGGIIIADRYTTSNAIHQCSKLPAEKWDDFIRWLFDFEYKLMNIPAPDAVIYLRTDPDVSQKLMTSRYNNDESKKDIHERNKDHLRKSRAAADHCAEALGWNIVECTENGCMRSIQDISAQIISIINNVI